jgi:hypothetical protein
MHDEDGDGIVDACDPCPHIAGTDADADGDGVGDACDPQPTVPKQQLTFFDPFTSQRAEWSAFDVVTFTGGRMIMGAGNADSSFARLDVPNGETRIYTAGTIASCGTPTPHELAINFGVNNAGANYHYVQAYDSGQNDGYLQIMKAAGSSFIGLDGQHYPGTAPPTGAFAFRVDQSVTAQAVTFDAVLGGTTYPTMHGTTSSAPAMTTGASYGFFTRNCEVRFDYFVVITTTP